MVNCYYGCWVLNLDFFDYSKCWELSKYFSSFFFYFLVKDLVFRDYFEDK